MSAETEKLPTKCTIKEAKEILGVNNVFGPEEWKKCFGDKFQVTIIPEIPWSRAELEKPEIKQEHFLFLGLEQLGGEYLNLPSWTKLFPSDNYPKFYRDFWFLKKDFAQVTCKPRWYFMPLGIVEGSRDYSYDQQISMLPNKYEVPNVVERVAANMLYYLLNKKFLDPLYLARTAVETIAVDDLTEGFVRVHVSGSSPRRCDEDDWLIVSYNTDEPHGLIGISASRKI